MKIKTQRDATQHLVEWSTSRTLTTLHADEDVGDKSTPSLLGGMQMVQPPRKHCGGSLSLSLSLILFFQI